MPHPPARYPAEHRRDSLGDSPSVVVVGGGPGGALTAILLADAGAQVVLIERQRFPRDKVCGECISATGIAVLKRAGLDKMLQQHGPAVFHHTALISPEGRAAIHDLSRPMWGLTRRVMDSALLQAAADRGVRVIQPARVEAVYPTASGVRVTARLEDNTPGTFECDYAVVADGKSALFGAKPLATSDLGVKAHFRHVRADRSTIYLFSLHGHYGGLAAVEDGLWNVALSVPQDKVKQSGGDLAAVWQEAMDYSPFLRLAFAGAEQVGDWLASPLPRFPVRTDWPERVVPVGNAAAALEPIGGEGMGLAMRSGELAAAAIAHAARTAAPLDRPGLQAAYRRLWRSRRPACRTVAVAMSMPRVAEAVVPLSRVAESATRAVLGLMGKSSDR